MLLFQNMNMILLDSQNYSMVIKLIADCKESSIIKTRMGKVYKVYVISLL